MDGCGLGLTIRDGTSLLLPCSLFVFPFLSAMERALFSGRHEGNKKKENP